MVVAFDGGKLASFCRSVCAMAVATWRQNRKQAKRSRISYLRTGTANAVSWRLMSDYLRRGGRRRYHTALFSPVLRTIPMKAETHPKYEPVVFQDVSTNFSFLTRSTMTSKEKIKWEDGKEYPVVKVEISSQSHPFYTGKHKIVDSGGRVDKFRRRYGAK